MHLRLQLDQSRGGGCEAGGAELLAAGGRDWALLSRQQLEDAIESDAEDDCSELAGIGPGDTLQQ